MGFSVDKPARNGVHMPHTILRANNKNRTLVAFGERPEHLTIDNRTAHITIFFFSLFSNNMALSNFWEILLLRIHVAQWEEGRTPWQRLWVRDMPLADQDLCEQNTVSDVGNSKQIMNSNNKTREVTILYFIYTSIHKYFLQLSTHYHKTFKQSRYGDNMRVSGNKPGVRKKPR